MSEKRLDEKNVSSAGTGLSSDITKAGILRKLKTMKKKYFVLRAESETGPARLEYFDSEKKFKSGINAKRSITIKTCFNINRKIDAKQKLAIALYTKDDCFSVVADSESGLEEWLNAMLELHLDEPCLNGGAKLKPKFEHVWQVNVGEKSLACSRNMKGFYRLCLTPSSLTLIKVEQSDDPETLEFPLMSIRRCGHTNNYFLIELGRSSIIGAGELWLETEDVVIAQNMHEVILNAMKSCREHEDLGPLPRPRSASNSENSRPIATRRPVAVVSPQTISYGGIRDRCDSMPSRPRTISEGQEINSRSYYAPPNYMLESLRPNPFSRTVSYSPPGASNPLSPMSATCSTDSAGSSLSIDEFDSSQKSDFAHGRYLHSLPTDGALHTEPPIKEEQLDDYMSMSAGETNTEGYISMAPLSASAPTGPSMFLSLNSSNSSNSASLPPISQGNDYMDMKSPSTEGYIHMSPVGTNTESRFNKSSSSLLDESAPTHDGYIHITPSRNHHSGSTSSHHDGYLDMAPLSSSLPKTFSAAINISSMPAKRDSSAKLSDHTTTSSPSSTNLEEFPLDKVKSLLTDTEETSSDYIRPVRAYSMGSRPQPKKAHLPIQVDGSRIRAYSVGSQASTARRKINNPTDRELGSLMRIDPRTGSKSLSAPLLNNRPPRIRSSTSRGDVEEDLMEIDYNRCRYGSGGGFDLCDSNFTIEPVGRSRSGSYSSSTSNALKLLQDKSKSHSTGHSCNHVTSCTDAGSDYLSMSPSSNLSFSKSSSVASSPVIAPGVDFNAGQKKDDHDNLSGDYVSLDPSSTYNTVSNMQGGSLLTLNSSLVDQDTVPMSYSINANLSNAHSLSALEAINSLNTSHLNGSLKSLDVNSINNKKRPADQPSQRQEYMCMDYNKNNQIKSFIKPDAVSTNDHSSVTKTQVNPGIGKSELLSEERKTRCLESLSQVKSSSNPPSPVSKSPSPLASPSYSSSFIPHTPPPSPYYGVTPTTLSGAPLIESLVRRLSQPSATAATHSDTSSRPISLCGETQLNYASLDLPPASEDDVTSRLRKSHDGETKESLTYAQIDFSPMRKKAVAEMVNESLSHL